MTDRAGTAGHSYSERIDAALRFASAAHHQDVRKGTRIPYAMHPFHVGLILDRYGWPEDVVIAGILHDVLEDPHYGAQYVQQRLRAVCSPLSAAPRDLDGFKGAVVAFVREAFGQTVLDLVEHVTEKKTDEFGQKRPWRIRKEEQLAGLAKATPAQAAVKAADCLHNLHAMSRDVGERGAAAMSRFKGGAVGAIWYNAHATEMVSQLLGDTGTCATELYAALDELEAALTSCGVVAGSAHRDPWSGSLAVSEVGKKPLDTGLWALGPRGGRIHGFGHWFSAAPPKKGASQWRDQASAKELARAWTRGGCPGMPAELRSLFESNALTRGLTIATAYAEHVTSLPVGPDREGRNHDLLALGMAGQRKVVVGIEAKAAEQLGPEVGAYRLAAEAKNCALVPDDNGVVVDARRSLIPERIDDCARRIFGAKVPNALETVRYQLVHAVAATILEAERRGADLAVFVVHQFVGGNVDASRIAANTLELQKFVRLLFPSVENEFEPGKLYGPVHIPGSAPDGYVVDLLVGEATSVVA